MSFYGLKPLALTSDMPESQGTPSRGGKEQGSMGHKLSRADHVMRKRQKKKQRIRKRTKSSRNPS
jgi:hypothetical protein